MNIHWGRIVLAGVLAEIVPLVIYNIVVRPHLGSSLARLAFVGFASFVFMVVGALWVARKIETRFVLHGTLVGVVAVVVYVLVTLPLVVRRQYPMNYWVAAFIGHPPKILGGAAGGFLAGRLSAKKVIVQKAAKSAM
jgi:hypothetical protein